MWVVQMDECLVELKEVSKVVSWVVLSVSRRVVRRDASTEEYLAVHWVVRLVG